MLYAIAMGQIIMMLMLTMTNNNDIALKSNVTIPILFVFGQIIVLIIRIQPNGKDPLFGTSQVLIFFPTLSLYVKKGAFS